MGTDVKKTRFISIFLFSLTAALLLSACRGPEKAGNPPAGTASSPELQTPAASAPRAESQMPVLRITTERNAAVTSKEESILRKLRGIHAFLREGGGNPRSGQFDCGGGKETVPAALQQEAVAAGDQWKCRM